jgi:hypothetical protein
MVKYFSANPIVKVPETLIRTIAQAFAVVPGQGYAEEAIERVLARPFTSLI